MAQLMDIKYFEDYDSWTKTIWAMRNAGYTYEFCMKLSARVEGKFDELEFDRIWESKTNKEQSGLGTIYYQAKMSNEKEFYDIKLRNIDVPIYESNEYNIAEVLLSVFGENLVFYNDFMMVYTKDKWRIDTKLDLLRVMISQEYYLCYISKGHF